MEMTELEKALCQELLPACKRAIEAELPEDEPDTIPDWCYHVIMVTVFRATREAVQEGQAVDRDPSLKRSHRRPRRGPPYL